MNYKAVIFDLDGTLLDTLEDIARSLNRVLLRAGLPAHGVATYRSFIGYGFSALVKRALPEEHRDEESVQLYVSLMRSEYSRLWADNTRPHRGIPELLDALCCANIRMAVLSNKPDDFTKAMVAGLLGRWHFDQVLGTGSAFPRKPDPAGALAIAGALWGFQKAEELAAGGARALVSNPADVLLLRHAGPADRAGGRETIYRIA